MSRANQWFVLADGIAREVIAADITRYLGNDASVRPGMGVGEYEGRRGFWIMAYRTLTSAMIEDLQTDSRRWEQEQRSGSSRNTYQDSRTHANRVHSGPSPSATYTPGGFYDRQPAPMDSAYGTHAGFREHREPYTAAATTYSNTQPAYQATSHTTTQVTMPDPYGPQSSQLPTGFYGTVAFQTPPSAPPGYYIASDGRQYPLPQHSQSPGGASLPENRSTDSGRRSGGASQATLPTDNRTDEPQQSATLSPVTRRYRKRSYDDAEGAGSMSSAQG